MNIDAIIGLIAGFIFGNINAILVLYLISK